MQARHGRHHRRIDCRRHEFLDASVRRPNVRPRHGLGELVWPLQDAPHRHLRQYLPPFHPGPLEASGGQGWPLICLRHDLRVWDGRVWAHRRHGVVVLRRCHRPVRQPQLGWLSRRHGQPGRPGKLARQGLVGQRYCVLCRDIPRHRRRLRVSAQWHHTREQPHGNLVRAQDKRGGGRQGHRVGVQAPRGRPAYPRGLLCQRSRLHHCLHRNHRLCHRLHLPCPPQHQLQEIVS
mmetsp:Transcript_24249/g.48230  ORF Transcript_24249/g.48230 Transcript_24249/m.48230 type:complete len:234 (+) Transcript_24249:440-1141(+)